MKKQINKQTNNTVTRKVVYCVMNEFILINMIDGRLSTIVHYFVPFIEKWHNLFLGFSWGNRDISGLQHPN